MSTSPAAFTAEILSTSSAGLARLAAERVVTRLADTSRYGHDPLGLWRDHLAGRLDDLSRALAEERPQRFTDQVGWAKVAFASRGIPEEDLRASLRCLAEVLASELPEQAGSLSATCVEQALARWDDLGEPEPSALHPDTDRGRLASRYVVALLEGDRRRACGLVLDEVRSGRLDVSEAILEVCLPVEKELGRMWHLDEITVAEEHFVSAATVTLMAQLLVLAPPVEPHGRTLVAAASEGDDHDIGLRAVSTLFELDGWRTVFLGGNLPAAEVAWAAAAFSADLVVVSASLAAHLGGVARVVGRLRALESEQDRPPVPVLVGGPAFAGGDEVWREVGADALARSARDAVATGRRLVGLG